MNTNFNSTGSSNPPGCPPPYNPRTPANTAWRPPLTSQGYTPAFPEPPERGINSWTMKAAWWCKRSGMPAEAAIQKIQSVEPRLHRKFKADEVVSSVAKVYSYSRESAAPQVTSPKWPEFNTLAQADAIENSPFTGLTGLRASSPINPAWSSPDMAIDALFPGNPLLCMSEAPWSFGTVYREDVRGILTYVSHIVPSSMTSVEGHTLAGEISQHTLENTGHRKYQVTEFDGGQSLDEQASIIGHLSKFAPLACVCFSGGKSLHAWFNVEGHPEATVIRFFKYAVSLGADRATWSRAQFCRLPGGYNHDKDKVQDIHYLSPRVEWAELPEPPTVSAGFTWDLQWGGDHWTNDAEVVVNLSDPPLIAGIMRKCEVGTVVGAAKTSKTWFTLRMALSVSEGAEFLGRRTFKAKTLYLDYELKLSSFKKRLCMLTDSKPDGFHFQCFRGCQDLPTVDQIADLIIEEGFELVIVDSLYRTGWLTEENSNDKTGRELSILQQLATRTNCTILVVDHTAKGGGNDRSAVDASRGASTKGGFFDFIFVLRPGKGSDADTTYVVLDPVLRDWPGLTNLPLVSFRWTPLSCRLVLEGEVPADDPDLLKDRILGVLATAGKGVGIKVLAADLVASETTLRRAMDSLVAAGRIIRFQDPNHSQRVLFRLSDGDGEVADPLSDQP
ncbi:MAG: AAA family ATPase [Luteolibacter sp.]